MNEDENGITPADVTAMTIEADGPYWVVTIEQGNGDRIKQLVLTHLERSQLHMLLEGPFRHVEFVDHTRPPFPIPLYTLIYSQETAASQQITALRAFTGCMLYS